MARGPYPNTSNLLIGDTSYGSPVTDYPFSVSLWYKQSSWTNSSQFMIAFASSSQSLYTATYWYRGTGDITHYTNIDSNNGGTFGGDPASGVFEFDVWHHYCWICASATSRIVYIDNALQQTHTTSYTIYVSKNRWAVGCLPASTISNPATNTVFAEVAVYDVALDVADVATLSDSRCSPLFVKPSDLKLYVPMQDGTSGDAVDRLGSYPLDETGTVATASHPTIVYPSSMGQVNHSAYVAPTPLVANANSLMGLPF